MESTETQISKRSPSLTQSLGRRVGEHAAAALPVLGLTLVAAVLRFSGLGDKPLWLDEALAFRWGSLSADELWSGLARVGQHPPLYFLSLRAAMELLGDSEWVLRSVSALASTATVPVVYAIGRVVRGRATAVLAALLVAVAPWHVSYAQEARMYALLTLEMAVAILGFALLLRQQEGPPTTRADRRHIPLHDGWLWFAYVAGMAAALWTHSTSVFFPAACTLVVVGWGATGQIRAPFLRKWVWAHLLVVLLWGPWIAVFLQQAAGVYQGYWIPPPDWRAVTDVLRNSFVAFVSPALSDATSISMPLTTFSRWRPWLDLGCLALVCLGLWALRRDPRWMVFVLALWLVPPLGELVVSLKRPIFLDRTLLWTSIPLYLLMAEGLRALRTPLRMTALVGLLGFNVIGLRHYYVAFEKEAWDQAASHVSSKAGDRDVVLFVASFVQHPFDYYFDRHGGAIAKRGLPVDARFAHNQRVLVTAADVERLPALLAGHNRAFLVYGYAAPFDPDDLVRPALARLATLTEVRSFHGVEVYVYQMFAGMAILGAPLFFDPSGKTRNDEHGTAVEVRLRAAIEP